MNKDFMYAFVYGFGGGVIIYFLLKFLNIF